MGAARLETATSCMQSDEQWWVVRTLRADNPELS